MQSKIITQHYNQLSAELAKLKYLITCDEPSYASVAVIPDKEPDQIHFHGLIEPEHFSGRAAASKAAASYVDLHLKPGACTKTARRTVGVLYLSPDINPLASEIPACVEAINQAKENIEQYLIANYPTRTQRFDALRAECPGIMALHLYRKIRCLTDQNILKVHFTWQRKTSLVKPKKEELLLSIGKEISVASQERADELRILLANVASTPVEQLRLRRAVRPQPSANVWFKDEGTRTLTAPMPLIVIQENSIGVKILGDFDPSEPPPNRVADKLVTRTLGVLRGADVLFLV